MSNFIKEIKHLGEKYAIVLDTSSSPEGLTFVTDNDEYIQAGLWNYKKGTKLPAHYHNYFERTSYRTAEVVYVVEGEVQCSVFTEEGDLIWLVQKSWQIINLIGDNVRRALPHESSAEAGESKRR